MNGSSSIKMCRQCSGIGDCIQDRPSVAIAIYIHVHVQNITCKYRFINIVTLFYICLQIVFSVNGSATQSHAKNAYIIAVLAQKAHIM